jgi:H+/Cl- antiporter ClcA
MHLTKEIFNGSKFRNVYLAVTFSSVMLCSFFLAIPLIIIQGFIDPSWKTAVITTSFLLSLITGLSGIALIACMFQNKSRTVIWLLNWMLAIFGGGLVGFFFLTAPHPAFDFLRFPVAIIAALLWISIFRKCLRVWE